jgi:flagellar hook-associated protein 3 FlgL
MRVSTAGIHASALAGIIERNAEMVKLQNQIATGKRIRTPADDPTGAVRAAELDRLLSESSQHARNSDVATNRLSLEEQTLGDVTSLLQRVRDLTVQGNNATVDAAGRQTIATEIKARLDELLSLANHKDANGEYLFAGFKTLTQPFGNVGTSVQYFGDQGTRALQVGPSQTVVDGHSGYEVFMDVPQGNGTFYTRATATNTGTGIIDTGSVTNPTAWVSSTYTITFTSPTTYEVRNATSALVSSGTYTSSGAITFNGAQVTVTGAPATNDTFTVGPSASEDMFTTLNKLVATLNRPGVPTSDSAQFSTEMGAALTQLDSALDHVSSVRSAVGARLSVLQSTADGRADTDLELKQSLSQLRDLDYADAVTKLNVQLVGLQAAQSSYAKLSQLSLFNFL